MSELSSVAIKIGKLTDKSTLKPVMRAAGMAGKKAALNAAADDLGGDRRMSRFRRGRPGPPLGAGYDISGTEVTINFRPGGLWILADKGRRGGGTIRPRKAKALATPFGPRASVAGSSSRGLNTYEDAKKDAQRDVPKAAAREFFRQASRTMGG